MKTIGGWRHFQMKKVVYQKYYFLIIIYGRPKSKLGKVLKKKEKKKKQETLNIHLGQEMKTEARRQLLGWGEGRGRVGVNLKMIVY